MPRGAKGSTPPSHFVLWCEAHKLPEPQREFRFHRTRKWRFDYAWQVVVEGCCDYEARNVAVEVEGGVFAGGRHTRGAGFVRDCAKYNAAALQGWIVLRYTPQQLTSPQTLADLKQALGL